MSKKFYISEKAEKFCKENKILDVIESINPSSLSFYSDKDNNTLLADCDVMIIKNTLRDIMSEVCGWPKARVVEEYLIDAILEEIPVCLVTKEESEDKDNSFKCPEEAEYPILINNRKRQWSIDKGCLVFGVATTPNIPKIPKFVGNYDGEDKIDPLGCYVLDGIIFLFVDRIYDSSKKEGFSEIKESVVKDDLNFFWCLLHKVMLHEYIHAFFHIDETLEKINNKWNSKDGKFNEESLDNALVIYSYIQGASKELLRYSIWYISEQPEKYKASLEFLGLDKNSYSDDKDFQLFMEENRKKLVEAIREMIANP